MGKKLYVGNLSYRMTDSDLEQMFDKRAKEVYGQALEIAELIGVSQSFDRFIHNLFSAFEFRLPRQGQRH